MCKERFTFFWSNKSCFSQWYPCTIVMDGIKFNCAEQAMMYYKATMFQDFEIAERILRESLPYNQKELGRGVRNFNQRIWDENCMNLVYNINESKFKQNSKFLEELLKTKGTTIVEASPYDTIWGIGLDSNDLRALDRNTWEGKNLLGEILTKLRENLLKV